MLTSCGKGGQHFFKICRYCSAQIIEGDLSEYSFLHISSKYQSFFGLSTRHQLRKLIQIGSPSLILNWHYVQSNHYRLSL